MLSGETSAGQYPVKCVEIMDRVARRTEKSGGAGFADSAELDTDRSKLMKAATVFSHELGNQPLVIFSSSGATARLAAWLRPQNTPIYAFTNDEKVYCQLSLNWGTEPFLIEFHEEDPSKTDDVALDLLKNNHKIKSGETIALVTEVKVKNKQIATIQMKVVD